MKFGISSLVFLPEGLKSTMEKIAENHFDCWEIVCEGNHYLSPKNIKYLMELKDRYEVDIVVHAPFSDLNPASMNERVRRLTVDCITDAIEGAFELDASVVVVHPGYIPPLWSNYVEDILDNNFSTLSDIVEVAEDYGITIGLENMPNFKGVLGITPESLREIVKDIDSKYLGITFDIGHANTIGNPADFVEELNSIGEGIVHVHIHDNNGYDDEHLKIGEGKIDFLSVLKKLKEIKYDGVLSIENKNVRDAVKSKEVLNEYLSILDDLKKGIEVEL
ncbi:sugar phosphate isomerase/epimerase family protein [Methanotorris igneus]|uniref:Xylose isomerase domain-containing protein TIM barrel n=1 Tax=Methanotorris igneus (strain DSM 5666 / JCM 11834 / Kol 5) TaxID=880724 RepID=F6BE86_METIK|nr:sugar phosphate isomerase/epimerase [Methanotorris igneus]AEF96763.1 Xylose isomerase domain-containing protein TIM barrel [Methanotorris igneus Kol 5]